MKEKTASYDLFEKAQEVARLLEEHKGSAVEVLNVHASNNIADCFVIATASSTTHLKSLAKYVRMYIKENDLEVYLTKRKFADSDDWILIDAGLLIVHLFTADARLFYDLESLYIKDNSDHAKKQACSLL